MSVKIKKFGTYIPRKSISTKKQQKEKQMKKLLTGFLVFLILTTAILPNAVDKKKNVKKINLAILLDTSNSMDGLINQARQELWRIVNEMASLSKDVPDTKLDLRISLFEYGNDGLKPTDHYIRMVDSLSQDLDKVSEHLFGLVTNGGAEYCGAVIEQALLKIDWSKDNDAVNVILIAGNEPFNQGIVDYKNVCKKAAEKGIKVNTIYCGNPDNDEAKSWRDGSTLGNGSFMFIDQNLAAEQKPTPYDKNILDLNNQLNDTYLYFSKSGKEAKMRQEQEDNNALMSAPSAAVQRAGAKATEFYNNSKWDLVDASKEEGFDLKKLDKKDLPEEFKNLTETEIKSKIAQYDIDREKIKIEIKKYEKLRNDYLAKSDDTPTQNTFGSALIQSIKSELKLK